MATILLIDDDADVIEINRTVLAKRGHKVLTARSAAEARVILAKTAPDAAVVDVMMETDSAGFELAREIREKFPKMPTIILSGVHQAKDLPFRFEPDETYLPVVKVLDKPVPPQELAETIEALLKK
jgi:CheY-like chemotaxis protein